MTGQFSFTRRHLVGAAGGLLGFQALARPDAPPPAPAAPAGVPDEAYWRKLRQEFSLADGFAFLNNGTCGPTPRKVVETHQRYDQELAANPSNNFRAQELDGVRRKLAEFVNATPNEIALTHSTTEGLNIFAHGLDWKQGDEVVLARHEHFGGYEPYQALEKRSGIKIVWVDLPAPAESPEQILQIYERAFTPRTRAIMVSQVMYVTGLVTPIRELAALAHSHGALISVDGAQSFGVLPLDVRAAGIDHYAGPGQKWLLAGTGTGFSYFKQDLQDRVWPLYGHYDPAGTPEHGPGANPERVRSARRYERSGQINIPAALGVETAVDFQLSIGKANIEARARQLGSRLRAGLKEIPGVRLWNSNDPRIAANITSFALRDLPPATLVTALLDRERIQVRAAKIGDVSAVRVSTHFYNSPEEVDRLLTAVGALSRNPPQVTAKSIGGAV
jgi:isopenicillin-N epimerase